MLFINLKQSFLTEYSRILEISLLNGSSALLIFFLKKKKIA